MNRNKEKQLNKIAWILTVVIVITVLLMRRVKISTELDLSFLPIVHSMLNLVTASVP